MKRIFYTGIFSTLAFAAIGQVKIGTNPTQFVAGAKLQIDGDNTIATPAKLIVNSTGNVGIGTAAPANMLHVKGSTDPVKFEGLQSVGNGVDSVLVTDPTTGVLKYKKLGTSARLDSTSFWKTLGNNSTTSPTSVGVTVGTSNYFGTSDANNLAIGTNGTTRAIFDRNGSLYGGSGTYNPAFTVGPINSLVWGLNNIDSADNNLVVGKNNTIGLGSSSGNANKNSCTIVAGIGNTIAYNSTAYNSIIGGTSNTINGACFEVMVFGTQHNLTNAQKFLVQGQGHVIGSTSNPVFFGLVSGFGNNVQARYGLTSGSSNIINQGADYALVGGAGNSVSSPGALVGGLSNTVSTAAGDALVAGTGNTINAGGIYGVALGQGNTISANVSNSMAIGKGVVATVSGQFASSFAGGYNFYTNTANTTGVALAANGASFTSISDKRSKNSIQGIGYGLYAIMALRPMQYRYNGNTNSSLGFIAQDVMAVLPEVVEQTTMGPNHDYLGINYTELIPVLTKAIQEQQEQIEDLRQEVLRLKKHRRD